MDPLPLVCSFEDGCILTLVVVDAGASMDGVAAAVAEHFVGRMLPPQPGRTMRVRLQGSREFLPRALLARDAGWKPMTTIEIGYEDHPDAVTRH
jgi:hypothetical protein